MWASRQTVRATRPRGSTVATTLRLSPLARRSESGVRRSPPSLASSAAARPASAPRATRRRRGSSAGTTDNAAITPNGWAKLE